MSSTGQVDRRGSLIMVDVRLGIIAASVCVGVGWGGVGGRKQQSKYPVRCLVIWPIFAVGQGREREECCVEEVAGTWALVWLLLCLSARAAVLLRS